MALASGTRIGPYVVQSLLGSGGMGEVYRAFDERLRRDIALKLIARRLDGESDIVDRFIREALAVSALNHPNVITIHEAGGAPEGRYIAMELVQGRSLREVLREGAGRQHAVPIARQIAEALAVAHAAQIVHRDIKPDNVMVRDDGYVKVLDFGLARVATAEAAKTDQKTLSAITQTGLVLGTIGYMSPEQARGEQVTTASDVFAFGIILYELLTGQHPFHAASPLAVLHGIISDAPVPPSRVGVDVSPTLDQLTLECLQKDARLRPTATEIVNRLRGGDAAVGAVVSPPQPRPEARLVGREAEGQALADAYQEVAAGRGLIVAVAGEPGLGKTALVESALECLHDARVARGRCSERLAGSEAYLPFLEALDALLRSESHGGLARVLRAVAPNWYAQVMSLPENDSSAARVLAEAGTGSPQRMKREMAAFLEEASRLQPLVLFLDDLHWADGSTVDLLGYLADRLASIRLGIVVTYRPSELVQSRHPFLPLKLDLQARGVCREIVLRYLPESAVADYVALEFPDHAFPTEFVELIHHRTEGHCLFFVDLLRELRRRKVLVQDAQDRWVLAEGLPALERELPESVRSMIQRKIDALSDDARHLLSAAAVQGVDFDSAIVAHALDLDEQEVEERLDRLEREHAIVRVLEEITCPDRTVTQRYRFAHVLYQNALFASLRPTRRASLAGSIASGLVRRWADRAPEIAGVLAALFETARASLAAARYFSLAAQSAARLFAHEEARQLSLRGLALLHSLPDNGTRRAVELELQMVFALAVKTSRGYAVPEVGQAYRRARELCRQVDDPAVVIPVLMGLSAHYIVGGDIRIAYELAEQLLELATRIGNPPVRMIAEWCLGAALHHLGELERAHAHLERALELYEPRFHHARVWEVGIEPGIFCMCETSRTLTLLGRLDQGRARIASAERAARELGHPQTIAFTLLFRMLIGHLWRDAREVNQVYHVLAALCADKGIAQEMLWATPVYGWAQFELGDREAGLATIERGVNALAEAHSWLLRPYYLLLHSDALRQIGRLEDAASALELGTTAAMGTHMFGPELHRLRGEQLLTEDPSNGETALEAFEKALAEARRQGAALLELRAARSMAAALKSLGRTADARLHLEPVLASITEGEAARDVIEARDLMRSLEGAA
jgi:tRNA A-37 threonylcarbamoyl transferase component Bud32/tetratricopeptide (TPR) repeat protein